MNASTEYRTVRATVALANGTIIPSIYAGAVTDADNLASFKRRARAAAVETAAARAGATTVGARVNWTVEEPTAAENIAERDADTSATGQRPADPRRTPVSTTTKAPRKHTRFDICDAHTFLRTWGGRHRLAEVFCEGGPAAADRCTPGTPCRIWPGTDMFEPSVCTSEADWPANWRANTHPTTAAPGLFTVNADGREHVHAAAGHAEARAAHEAMYPSARTTWVAHTRLPLDAETIPFWGGWADAPACLCGNSTERDSFATTDALGTHVPDGGTTPHTHFTCLSCGRVATEVPHGTDTTPFERRPEGDAPEERVTIPGAGIVVARLDSDALAVLVATDKL